MCFYSSLINRKADTEMDWVHCPIAKKKKKKKLQMNENKHGLGSKACKLTITPSLASRWSPLVSDCVCKAARKSLFILTLFPLIFFVFPPWNNHTIKETFRMLPLLGKILHSLVLTLKRDWEHEGKCWISFIKKEKRERGNKVKTLQCFVFSFLPWESG